MSQLTLRFSVVERNERGQEVELVRKALQFKPQVSTQSVMKSSHQVITLTLIRGAIDS